MRKQDLKVGEEYAAYLNPSTARRNWGRGKPHRVRLIALEGEIRDTFTVRTWEGEERTPGTKEITGFTKGILVEWLDDEPVTRHVPEIAGSWSAPYRYSSGRRDAVYLTPADGLSGLRHNDPEADTVESKDRTYGRVCLENAGCFVQTWAEQLAEDKAEVEAKEERRKRQQAQWEEEARLDAPRREKLAELIDRLTSMGYEVRADFLYSDERQQDPWQYDVYRPSGDGTHTFAFRLDPNYSSQDKLLYVEVEKMNTDVLVELLLG